MRNVAASSATASLDAQHPGDGRRRGLRLASVGEGAGLRLRRLGSTLLGLVPRRRPNRPSHRCQPKARDLMSTGHRGQKRARHAGQGPCGPRLPCKRVATGDKSPTAAVVSVGPRWACPALTFQQLVEQHNSCCSASGRFCGAGRQGATLAGPENEQNRTNAENRTKSGLRSRRASRPQQATCFAKPPRKKTTKPKSGSPKNQ